jgi:hypothetical protein
MSEQNPVDITEVVGHSPIPTDPPCHWCHSPMMVQINSDKAGEWFLGQVVCTKCWSAGPEPTKVSTSQLVALSLAVSAWTSSPHGFEPRIDVLERMEGERDAAVARAEAAEKRADDAIERTRVATLQSAIEAIESRAVHRGAQVDVAQAANGAWEVVAGKESELLAVADLLRARLRPGPEVATD